MDGKEKGVSTIIWILLALTLSHKMVTYKLKMTYW